MSTGDSSVRTIKQLADQLDAMKARRAAMASSITDDRGALIALDEQSQRLFAGGDEAGEATSLKKSAALKDRIKSRETALSLIDAEIVKATAEHAEADRMQLADQTATDKGAALKKLASATAATSKALADLRKACEPLVSDSFLVRQVSDLVTMLPTDLQGALDHAEAEVNSLIDGLRNGSIAPPMQVEHAPAPVEVVAKPAIETRRMLVLADVKWRHGTEVKAAAKQSTADMPTATADKAERLGYACAVGSPGWKKHNVGRGIVSLHPTVTGIVDLDDENLQQMKVAFGFDQHRQDAQMVERVNGVITQTFAGF
ncbi:hypothetical protein [Bradyrhizobium macuxiense]|uniref:hypothetical protein n=1 Tax=Bradyrhizobium macuxiense TaxID=1755647 RepID=UPI0010A95027|nr:hypothetical protein [Bradyrhizobium macuxiense]